LRLIPVSQLNEPGSNIYSDPASVPQMTVLPNARDGEATLIHPPKPRVLTFCRVFLPGFKAGGPIQSIANLTDSLSDEFDFFIVTSDRDTGDTVAYPGLEPRSWQQVGKAKVRYLAPQERRLASIARIMRATPHDMVYLNSFLNWHFTTLPLLAIRLGIAPTRPVILAPRGEFSPGALAGKRWRKAAFMRAAALARLHANVMWHASTEFEATDIREVIRDRPDIHVACNLPARIIREELRHNPRAPDHSLRILFLGRISPKKNLLFALDVLARVQPSCIFTVAGVVDDEDYWRECQHRLRQLRSNVSFRYAGPISHDQVPALLADHDLMFLPTRGENFGHAILEALAAGTPVLTSDQTPWRGLEAQQVGWDLSLDDPGTFIAAINAMARDTDADAVKRRERCSAFAEEAIARPKIELANRKLFRSALERR